MKELFRSITTTFNAGGDFYDNLGGRLYLLQVPERVSFPYAVYGPNVEEASWQFGDVDYERIEIEFEIYSDSRSATEILDLYENCKTMFDRTKMSITGFTHITMNRVLATLEKVEDSATGDRLWMWSVIYEILLRKN